MVFIVFTSSLVQQLRTEVNNVFNDLVLKVSPTTSIVLLQTAIPLHTRREEYFVFVHLLSLIKGVILLEWVLPLEGVSQVVILELVTSQHYERAFISLV